MAYFEIEGRLLQIYDTTTGAQSLPIRDFVIETLQEALPQYVKFQLTQERCPLIDFYKEGQKVKVQFELKGYDKHGQYFTFLHALRISGYKYQTEFDRLGLEKCPPIHYRELKKTSYRFVFSDLSHKNNFLPALLIQPARVNSLKDATSKCEGLGLSLFQSQEEAKFRFEELMVKTRRAFGLLAGDHLATISLDENNGVGNEPNTGNYSHFTFHEYAHTDLAENVRHVEKI